MHHHNLYKKYHRYAWPGACHHNKNKEILRHIVRKLTEHKNAHQIFSCLIWRKEDIIYSWRQHIFEWTDHSWLAQMIINGTTHLTSRTRRTPALLTFDSPWIHRLFQGGSEWESLQEQVTSVDPSRTWHRSSLNSLLYHGKNKVASKRRSREKLTAMGLKRSMRDHLNAYLLLHSIHSEYNSARRTTSAS